VVARITSRSDSSPAATRLPSRSRSLTCDITAGPESRKPCSRAWVASVCQRPSRCAVSSSLRWRTASPPACRLPNL
jgi:hypothetical protein